MNNPPTISGAIHLCLLALLLTLLLAQSVAAQPADNCSSMNVATGPVMLPFDGTALSAADDIDMASCGGETMGVSPDVVTCFTPQNSCSVNITCTGSSGNLTMGITSGVACSSAPNPCTTFSGGSTLSSGAFAVTMGTMYCVYCQKSGMGTLDTDIALSSGDCGLLPVELLSFSIESSATDGQSPKQAEPEAGGLD